MTIDDFLAIMKIQGWTKDNNYTGLGIKIINQENDLHIKAQINHIVLEQIIWVSNSTSVPQTLYECDTLEKMVDYISHLHPSKPASNREPK